MNSSAVANALRALAVALRQLADALEALDDSAAGPKKSRRRRMRSQPRGETVTETPEVLTPEEAAERLKVPVKTVVALCARGEVPGAIKVGRRWRIPAWGLSAMFGPRKARKGGRGGMSRSELLRVLD